VQTGSDKLLNGERDGVPMAEITVEPLPGLTIKHGSVRAIDKERRVSAQSDAPIDHFLEWAKDHPVRKANPTAQEEAMAAAAMCLRWGSYFAVLADTTKPVWKAPKGLGRITDGEMARINIESTSNLAALLRLRREQPKLYQALIGSAGALPTDAPTVEEDRMMAAVFGSLTSPKAAELVAKLTQTKDEEARLREHPYRIVANALINACWRNGPIEDVHAGTSDTVLPLGKRRISTQQVRGLMRVFVGRMAAAWPAVLRVLESKDWRVNARPFMHPR
jgi:hypothetical protein